MKKCIFKKAFITIILFIFMFGNCPGSSFAQTPESAKNVIFLIPDGFSASYATAYRWYKGKESILDGMLVGMHRTYSANSEVTDSAAAATAMATGMKTNNGMISISPSGKALKTILEAARDHGKATGLVATTTITYATPAAFAAHVPLRSSESEIAQQLLNNKVNVLLGGGRKFFTPSMLEEAKQAGYGVVSNREELANTTKKNKLIGLFSEGAMAPELDRKYTSEPSLKEMALSAINTLKNDENGFFLMIEGSQIDWAGHDNDAAWAMKDTESFEEAVKSVVDFAKNNKETLVVVAGDHDTGGMSVGGYGKYDANLEVIRNVGATGDYMASKLNANRSNLAEVISQFAGLNLTQQEYQNIVSSSTPDKAINSVISQRALIGWTTYQHTGVDVPLYAFGAGAELFNGLHQNTDLPKIMAKAMRIKFQPSN